MGRKTTSVLWECENPPCSKKYKRYKYQVEAGLKKHCSQECANEHRRSVASNGEMCPDCEPQRLAGKRYCKTCEYVFERRHMPEAEREARRVGHKLAMKPYKSYRGWSRHTFLQLKGEVPTCQICGKECGSGKSTALDHDHETDRNRGFLCLSCNTKLGWYERYSEEVDRYLASPPFFKQTTF